MSKCPTCKNEEALLADGQCANCSSYNSWNQ